MAKRRMFNLDIIDDDVFLSMPISAQALYFHLGMRADDDGFVTPLKVMRLAGSNQDDLRILIAKRYVLAFDSGVVVIKHWPIQNAVKKDRYIKTTYQKEFNELTLNEWGVYTEKQNIQAQLLDVSRITTDNRGEYASKDQNGTRMEPQVRLGKVNKHTTPKSSDLAAAKKLVDYFNQIFGREIRCTDGRLKHLKNRLKAFSADEIARAIFNARHDDFFNGGGGRGWVGDLDYLIRSDENTEKYLNKQPVVKRKFE